MLVTPPGGRLWRLRYRMYGREKLLSLGAYPDVTLKRAREKRDDMRKLIADGIDPSARRKAERGARAETFEAVATEWLELQSKALSAETISILGTRLKSFLYPYIGNRPVMAITAQELLATLRRIEARGRHETAHRVRALAGDRKSTRLNSSHLVISYAVFCLKKKIVSNRIGHVCMLSYSIV